MQLLSQLFIGKYVFLPHPLLGERGVHRLGDWAFYGPLKLIIISVVLARFFKSIKSALNL